MLLAVPVAAQAHDEEPFGRPTYASAGGMLSATWRSLREGLADERRTIGRCRAHPASCSPAALKFIGIVDEGQRREGLTLIGRINRAVRFSIASFSHNAPDSVRDRWQGPLDSLASGVGDCKHHAIVKYAALLEAGFAPDDLRIVIVKIKSINETHAMVAARYRAHWYAFDNRSLEVVESSELRGYEPLFILDQHGVRQFVSSTPQVAKAQRSMRVQ